MGEDTGEAEEKPHGGEHDRIAGPAGGDVEGDLLDG
jgi:hypothetical protein